MCLNITADEMVRDILCGIIGAWILLVTSKPAECRNSYLFVAPNTFRPGQTYSLHGKLLRSVQTPVTVEVKLTGTETVAVNAVTVNDQTDVTVNLTIPKSVSPGKFLLEVKGSGGLTFSETKDVLLEPKVTSVYMQTDKAVYKPGQTVHFRVFGVTADLRVVFDKLHVELYDPKDNKINQWHVDAAEVTSLGGVYVQHQVMSESPVLGTWKLKAKLLSYEGVYEEKTFKVDEYVLPKFEVEMDLPSFGRTQEKEFSGNIKAKYTFGKPVKGEVELRVSPKHEQFEWKNGQRVKTSTTIEMKMPMDGKASFTIATSRLEQLRGSLDGAVLVFEANVTESLTRMKQGDTQEVTFYKEPLKLEFPASLPETFKPGMTYEAVVKVSQQDDTAPSSVQGQLEVTVTEFRIQTQTEPEPLVPWLGMDAPQSLADFRKNRRISRPQPKPDGQLVSTARSPVLYSVPADGIVEFPISVDKLVEKITIQAKLQTVSAQKTLKKRHSPSANFLQLRSLTNKPKAGESMKITIKATESVNEVMYQIYARGQLIKSGTIPVNGEFKTWTFQATHDMSPKSQVLVMYVRTDGELVADALSINVDGAFLNKVSVNFNKTEAAPSDKIRFDVSADVGSNVNVLGVDKSVLLLGTGNDITQSKVVQDLHGYSLKRLKSSAHRVPVCDWFCWRWPLPVGGEDVKDVIDDSGVVVLTDATVYEYIPEPEPMPLSWGWKSLRSAMPAMHVAALSSMTESRRVNLPLQMETDIVVAPKDLAPVQQTRKLFPETWLWKSQVVPSGGVAHFDETVPDTITSWVATAFAVHPQTGLGISEQSAQLQVTLPFFVSVNLPYSVIRGEKIVLQVNIHNYSPLQQTSYVTLERSTEFDNLMVSGTSQTTVSQDQTRVIKVQPDEVAALYFPIIPTKLGLVDISVRAQTTMMADHVVKKLVVEAEGSPREYNVPFIIDLKTSGTQSKKINVEYPLRTVPGSERVKVTAVGDLMGPSINGLDNLIRLPTGCGEQNMLNFAPNIFIVKYLQATNNLDSTVMNKAKEFMEKGYQRELTYRHADGSFSAFGESDKSGSTWLTAFVVKSFVQAKPYIFIDDAVISKSVTWLVSQQRPDGSFAEPGRVIHTEMQGGSASGDVTLTAYVMAAMFEARSVQQVADVISAAKDKALAYLEGKADALTDTYEQAQMLYALQLAARPNADQLLAKLESKAIVDAGTKHWERAITTTTGSTKPWESRKGAAVDVELTSYVLLSLAIKADRQNGLQVLKWITAQRNAEGGFSSTQDTVVALQALAEMAALVFSDSFNLNVNIVGTGVSETFLINSLNARVLQTRELPKAVGEVTITASGQGMALVQVEVSYNIDDDDQKQSFELRVSLQKETLNDFEIRACAKWLENNTSSMAVMEVGTPSGFFPDLVSVVSAPVHKRLELDSRKVVLYFDEISSKDTCTTLTFHRSGMVSGIQPVPVRIFDYYNPAKQVTEFYVPAAIRGSEICDVCGPECDFCKA